MRLHFWNSEFGVNFNDTKRNAQWSIQESNITKYNEVNRTRTSLAQWSVLLKLFILRKSDLLSLYSYEALLLIQIFRRVLCRAPIIDPILLLASNLFAYRNIRNLSRKLARPYYRVERCRIYYTRNSNKRTFTDCRSNNEKMRILYSLDHRMYGPFSINEWRFFG